MKIDDESKFFIVLVSVMIIVFAFIFGISGIRTYQVDDTGSTMPLEGVIRPVETIKEDSESFALHNIIEPVETAEPIVEDHVEVYVEKTIEYYDVPLSEDLQNHIFTLCEESEIDPVVVISMIKAESNFDSSAIGDNGNSQGLMQIQSRWHKDRMDELGCTDLLDPYQNITVGVDLLSELVAKGRGIEWALMAYNGGPKHANDNVKAGTVSKYVMKVMALTSEIKTN